MDLPAGAAERFLRDFRDLRPVAKSFVLAVRDPKKEMTIDPSLVNAILTKPIEIETLAEVVRECALAVPPPVDPLHCPPAESSQPPVVHGDSSQLAN